MFPLEHPPIFHKTILSNSHCSSCRHEVITPQERMLTPGSPTIGEYNPDSSSTDSSSWHLATWPPTPAGTVAHLSSCFLLGTLKHGQHHANVWCFPSSGPLRLGTILSVQLPLLTGCLRLYCHNTLLSFHSLNLDTPLNWDTISLKKKKSNVTWLARGKMFPPKFMKRQLQRTAALFTLSTTLYHTVSCINDIARG